MEYEEEYEVIPTSPIRRLEKRVAKVEATTTTSESRQLIEQIIELIKSNQRVIDDIIKADAELRNEVSRLPGKIDELLASMSDFIELLKVTAAEEVASGSKENLEPLLKKVTELVEQNRKTQEISQATLVSLETIDKRLKRSFAPPIAYRR